MRKQSPKIITPENLRRAFERMGLGNRGVQVIVAEKLGVTSQAVNRWMMPSIETQPSLDKLIKIAELANMTLDELILGEERSLRIPLLNCFADAVAFCNGETIANKNKLPFVSDDLKHGFAVRLDDESMSPAVGKSYPQQTLLVFDTDKNTPKHEDFVFAIINHNNQQTGVFRRFVEVGGISQLIALNPLYPKIESNFTVVATLSYAILD
ncbi:MAG: LexA family transcriptional regulator [Neisseriaceae bacterium]|nr:LexA family transcriptional regulator [Neisseriaceae bacterium]